MATAAREQDLTSALPEELAPKQLADIAAIRAYLMSMLVEGRGESAIELLLGLLVQLRDSHTATSVRLQDALRKLYGRSSEKVSESQLQLVLSALVTNATQSTETRSPQTNIDMEGSAQPAPDANTPCPADGDEGPPKKKRRSGPRGRAALLRTSSGALRA